jgi:hypothetical protein
MASSRIISHSPPNLHRQPPPFDSVKPLPPQNLILHPKRHRNLRIHTSLRSSQRDNDLNDTVNLRTNSVSAVSNDVVSKDPISLPRAYYSSLSLSPLSLSLTFYAILFRSFVFESVIQCCFRWFTTSCCISGIWYFASYIAACKLFLKFCLFSSFFLVFFCCVEAL